MSRQKAILEVKGLTKKFSGLTALDDVSFEVQEGEIHSLIGPNGAGKTTVLNLLTRIYEPTAGDVVMEGTSLRALMPHQVVTHGIARTFQHVELFPRLSVLDNVALGTVSRGRLGIWESLLGLYSSSFSRQTSDSEARAILSRIGLEHFADREARELTGGQARLVGLARALATRPRLLLLDELVAGLNSQETHEVARIVRELRDKDGITLLVVEHDMRFVMSLSDRITVLNFGRRIATGDKVEIQGDEAVIEAYLGSGKYSHADG
jgi:branched-chain amino acid transport system ATP-binding protein